MADTPEFRRYALLPKPVSKQPSTGGWDTLSAEDLLRIVTDNADRLGSGNGQTFLLLALPDPVVEALEAAGAETADDEDSDDDDDNNLAVDFGIDRNGAVFIDDGELQPDNYDMAR